MDNYSSSTVHKCWISPQGRWNCIRECSPTKCVKCKSDELKGISWYMKVIYIIKCINVSGNSLISLSSSLLYWSWLSCFLKEHSLHPPVKAWHQSFSSPASLIPSTCNKRGPLCTFPAFPCTSLVLCCSLLCLCRSALYCCGIRQRVWRKHKLVVYCVLAGNTALAALLVEVEQTAVFF